MNKTIWPHYTMKWPNACFHPKMHLLPEVAVCPKVSSCCLNSVTCVVVSVPVCVLLPIITSVLKQCWRLCQTLFFLFFLPKFYVSSPLKNKQTKHEASRCLHDIMFSVLFSIWCRWPASPPAHLQDHARECEHVNIGPVELKH